MHFQFFGDIFIPVVFGASSISQNTQTDTRLCMT